MAICSYLLGSTSLKIVCSHSVGGFRRRRDPLDSVIRFRVFFYPGSTIIFGEILHCFALSFRHSSPASASNLTDPISSPSHRRGRNSSWSSSHLPEPSDLPVQSSSLVLREALTTLSHPGLCFTDLDIPQLALGVESFSVLSRRNSFSRTTTSQYHSSTPPATTPTSGGRVCVCLSAFFTASFSHSCVSSTIL